MSLPSAASAVRAEAFLRHWQQLRDIATIQMTVPSPDEMVAVLNLLDQLTRLLELELSEACEASEALSPGSSPAGSRESTPLSSLGSLGSPLDGRDGARPCLDLLLSENVLAHILATSRMPIEDRHADELRRQQLVLYATLWASPHAQPLLASHPPFLKPMLELLHQFDRNNAQGRVGPGAITVSPETELKLVLLLSQLCQRLLDQPELLEFFFRAEPAHPRFLVCASLVHYLHREGPTGQLARDALLQCLALSRSNPAVGHFIARRSNFCPLLATGLGGLYSLLPRQLPHHLESDPYWCRIEPEDLASMPELAAFLSSLEFCDAVLHIADPTVRENLLGLIYMGFLVPVLGPALAQSSEAEVICTTAYIDLFLRRLSEPSLLAVFLRFIFTDKCDEKDIMDELTIRISSQSKLCQVTLALFETFISLSCEDIVLWLVFRHLIPMRHILPSHRASIRHPDLHGRAAQTLLSLTPICCQEATSFYLESKMKANGGSNGQNRSNAPENTSSFSSLLSGFRNNLSSLVSSGEEETNADPDPLQRQDENFRQYLGDARELVRHRFEASLGWHYDYDGLKPPITALDGVKVDVSDGQSLHPAVPSPQHCGPQTNLGSNGSQDLSCDNGPMNSTALNDTAASSGYTSLGQQQPIPPHSSQLLVQVSSSPMTSSGPMSLTEEDQDFWSLMKDPTVSEVKLNKVIRKMQQCDQLSLSSGLSSQTGSQTNDNNNDLLGCSPLERKLSLLPPEDELDYSITSLGAFLDLLLEKVELMASNSLATNLLVTSILSSLAAYPQPLLRAVLTTPDIVFQPSVRGLYQAISSLRQKLDNIMPTLNGAEEAIILARKFLAERVSTQSGLLDKKKRRDSVASTISHLGQEARAHKSSITAAFSSMFRSKRTSSSGRLPPSPNVSPGPASFGSSSLSSPPNSLRLEPHAHHEPSSPDSHLSGEVRSQALAAVILEEWLLELAAIAQEQSLLLKEQVLEFEKDLERKRSNCHLNHAGLWGKSSMSSNI
eukprot:maker-scaffold419_size176504-snap-gene-0.35 protein:Tk02016 transcript:maker-scaffold419_size176504-snap-gene-0.35-mRNA-1 annotation:"upf0518 protein gk23746-like isoform x4"